MLIGRADAHLLPLSHPERRLADQSVRSVRDHLADYRSCLRAREAGEKHVRDSSRRVRLMLRLCGCAYFDQLSRSTVEMALGKLRQSRPRRRQLSLATVNHYLHNFKSFCRWMQQDYRSLWNPTLGIRGYNVKLDVRHPRRRLSFQELLRLFAAATAGPEIAGIPGSERAMTYVLAATTGLRSGELASLTRDSFHLDGDDPHIVVEAAYSKHRMRDTVQLRGDVVALLREYLAGVGRDAQLFRREQHSTRALVIDLAAAGIPYVHKGQYADFHALRHTFCSELFEQGASPKEAQDMARHRDPRLTLGRYGHSTPAGRRAVLERMPSITTAPSGPLDERTLSHANNLVEQTPQPIGATGNRTPIC